jgi:hypothetical protein
LQEDIMDKKTFGAVVLSGILAFSIAGMAQEPNGALEEDPEGAAPEVRRGFSWEPGFTYRPGFPAERRLQEEFGVSPEIEEEADPSDVTDTAPEETSPQEELGISPDFEREPLLRPDAGEIEPWEEDDFTTRPESRIEPSDPIEPERTIQR